MILNIFCIDIVDLDTFWAIKDLSSYYVVVKTIFSKFLVKPSPITIHRMCSTHQSLWQTFHWWKLWQIRLDQKYNLIRPIIWIPRRLIRELSPFVGLAQDILNSSSYYTVILKCFVTWDVMPELPKMSKTSDTAASPVDDCTALMEHECYLQ